MRLDYRVLVGIGALALIIGGAFAFDVYAGGWNVTDGMTKPFRYNDLTYNNVVGLHNYQVDPDGDFDAKDPMHDDYSEIKNPDIIVETSYPYYVRITNNGYLKMDEPQLYDTYTLPSGNNTNLYDHYTIALDVTIKTGAEFFSLTQTQMSYEAAVVDVAMRFNVALNPWVARGTWNENWTVVSGWAGIMSMSILDRTSGLTQPDATPPENVGHTIQGIMSDGAALNMWDAIGPVSQKSFDDTLGLVGVPSSVDGELTITLGAGAWVHVSLLGWDAVRICNVFVKYTVRIDIVTCLLLQPLVLGGQKPLGNPADNDTGYIPEIPILSDLMRWWDETWADLFNNPATFVLIVITIVMIGAVVYFVVKLFLLRRPGT